MDICKRLVALVARAFCTDQQAIILDILSFRPLMREEELATALGTTPKELAKACGKLKMMGMLKVETRMEEVGRSRAEIAAAQAEGKTSLPKATKERMKRMRTYYYIDYRQFVNIVKYKMYQIGKSIEKRVNEQMTHLPYVCQVCQKEFSALDMLTLDRTDDSIPKCDICQNEVKLDDESKQKNTSEAYTRFMNESQPIVELLKETDKISIPDSKPVLPDVNAIVSQPAMQQGPIIKEIAGLTGPQVLIEIVDDNAKSSDVDDLVKQEADGDDASARDLAEYYARLAEEHGMGEMAGVGSASGAFYGSAHGAAQNSSDDDDDEEFKAVPIAPVAADVNPR
ncbi:hypothetical protein HK105_205589 [Polyrhizophydium stewartii]|uniref:HTH TFE/IIEalpha-type domain-containing protein n=1 Tax=Polyrhizophydium stewartii TaxID=2732419 RepID=A0ABR4N5M4_9FUNG